MVSPRRTFSEDGGIAIAFFLTMHKSLKQRIAPAQRRTWPRLSLVAMIIPPSRICHVRRSAPSDNKVSIQNQTGLGVSATRRRRYTSRTLHIAAKSLLHKVGENVEGYASKKRVPSQPASQNGLDCTGSPCGTQKRKLATLDTPSLGEGVFIFNVFGEGIDDDRRSWLCKLKTRPPLQLRTRPRTAAATRAK